MPQEFLIRHSDNAIKLILTEDDIPIQGIWSSLDVWIGPVQLHRTADGDGVSLSTTTGELVIVPADLQGSEKTLLDALSTRVAQKVTVTVYSLVDDDGSVWGIDGDKIEFKMADRP